MQKLPGYVLVTPARNEARFIRSTIESVIAQTILPLRWVIVSDGSTDDTDEIIAKYSQQFNWIKLIRMPERVERDFAGKVLAFNAGKKLVDELPYQVIANLDADITFEPDYFSFLLERLAEDPRLGVVGTPYVEKTGAAVYDYRYSSLEHVSGACQMFRRDCFEQIGGYVPVKSGSEDTIAAISARMNGWKVRTFTDKVCWHRRGAQDERPILHAGVVAGDRDYRLGNHPVWELSRVAYQMTKYPFVLRGLAIAVGYLRACVCRSERSVSREMMRFRRREQMQRLKRRIVGDKQYSPGM